MPKYFCSNITVYQFCKLNNLNYQSFCSSIRYRIKKNKNNLNNIIIEVEEIYLTKRNLSIVVKHINNFKGNITVNNNEIIRDCKFLSISSKNVNYISKLNYTPSMVLVILFFFVKTKNKNNQIIINRRKFKKLLLSITNDNNLKNYVLLYRLNYKSIDDIYNIIDKKLIPRKAGKILRKYNLPKDSFDDIKSQLTIKLLLIINHLLPYEHEQIYKYIHVTLNSCIPEIYSSNRRTDTSIYQKVGNTNKELIEYINA